MPCEGTTTGMACQEPFLPLYPLKKSKRGSITEHENCNFMVDFHGPSSIELSFQRDKSVSL